MLLAAEYVRSLPSFAFVLVALSAWAGRSEGSVRTVGLVVVVVAFALRLAGPVYGWWSTTYIIDDAGASVTKGLFARRTRTMLWGRVKSVETTRPWNLRLFKLNRVTLIQAGEESAQVILRAVPDGDPLLFRLRSFGVPGPGEAPGPAERASTSPGGPTAGGDVAHRSEPDDEVTVHSLGRRDLVYVSLAYGQAFLLAPVVLMAAWEMIGTVGLSDGLSGTVQRFGFVPVAAVAVLGAMLLGVAGTVVRFHGFRVSVTRDGRLAIRYGLVEAHERMVDPGAVVGVVVQRNTMERLLGRARLSVVTRDASGGLGTSVIVPSVSLGVVDSLVRRHLGRFVTERTYRAAGRGALVRSAVSALALIAVPAAVFGLMVLRMPVGWAAVAALGSLLLLRTVGILATARLRFEEMAGVVVHTTLFSFERITTVAASAVHGVAALRRPGGRTGPPIFVTCHLYTGRARRLSAPRCDQRELDALRAAMIIRDSRE